MKENTFLQKTPPFTSLSYLNVAKRVLTLIQLHRQHECRSIEMKSDVFGHFTAQIKFSHISVISFALQKLLTVRISQNLFEHLIKPAQFWMIFNWNTISTQQHIYNSTDSEFWKDGVISTLRRFARINGRGSIFRFRFVIWRSLMNPSKQERFYN